MSIVQTRRSLTPGAVPPGGSLLEGQLAINIPDKIIWVGNTTGDPVLVYDANNVGVSDHTLLTNIGTNTHAAIDAHIADLANPHAVTYEQLGGTQPAPLAHTHLLADVTDSGSMAAVDDAPADGATYGRNQGAWVVSSDFLPEDVFGGSGISVERETPAAGQITIHSQSPQSIKARWLWEDSGSAGNPGDGNAGADQATSANMTQLVSSFIDADGQDVSSIVDLVAVDDSYLLFDDVSGAVAIFTVTAVPIDNVTWAKTLVVFAAGDATLDPIAGNSMTLQWFPKAADPVAPPHTHDHDGPDIINTGTNTHAAIDTHLANVANPHAVTAAQVGAEPANANIQAHIADVTTNPHAVTATQVGAAPAVHALDYHSDVVITTPAASEALAFDGTNWINQAFPAGVTVHGALTGLDQDDHPQYLTQARADALYAVIAHNHDAGTF